jgi:NAD(P)-dependent dehydrogenase (short-subunit alcohol dehydrogenase family)
MYAIVTGGNAGLGLSTAAELSKKGFHVTISVRNHEKGEQAVAAI